MPLPEVLAVKDPKDFRNRRVKINYVDTSDKRGYSFEAVGEEMGFSELMRLRKQGAYADKMRENLLGEGHVFANVGVSSVLEFGYSHRSYLLLVRQDRTDGSVCKLLSGYVDDKDFGKFESAALKEVAEELLPVTEDEMIFHGRKLVPLTGDIYLPTPYYDAVVYAPNHYALGSFWQQFAGISDVDTNIAFNQQLHFSAPTNSCQIVHLYCIFFPRDDGRKFSLFHAEDKLVDGRLEARLDRKGIVLAELGTDIARGKLTGRLFTFEHGEIVPYDSGGVVLSEAFAPKTREGIVERENIALSEYLASS